MAESKHTVREAAVLMQNLPSAERTELLGKLDPRQAAVVSDEMNRLGEIASEEREVILHDFAEAAGNRAKACTRKQAPPFHFLRELKNETLIDLLADEHPQAVALVLSYLPPPQAAAVLAGLSPNRQVAVVSRIAGMDRPEAEIVRDVEEALKLRLLRPVEITGGKGGLSGVVRILNVMKPAAERRLLDALAASDPEMLRDIRRVMFGPDVAERIEWPLVEAAG